MRKAMKKQSMNEVEMKKMFRQMNNDERLKLIENKVKSICYEITVHILMVFGALIAVFPPQNPSVIPIGILVLVGILVILNAILLTLYNKDKLELSDQPKSIPRITIGILMYFTLSVLLGIRLVTVGLTGAGVAFFIVLVIILGLSIVNIRNMKKYF